MAFAESTLLNATMTFGGSSFSSRLFSIWQVKETLRRKIWREMKARFPEIDLAQGRNRAWMHWCVSRTIARQRRNRLARRRLWRNGSTHEMTFKITGDVQIVESV